MTHQKKDRKIAIVGAGMAGIQVLYEYLKMEQPLEIHLFDKENQAGYGFPFVPDDEALLLNQPQEKMSLTGEEEHYKNWLKKHYPNEVDERYTTRMRFGEYSHELLDELLKDERACIHYQCVERLEVQGDVFDLCTGNQCFKGFEVVHLCFGQLPYSDPYQLKGKAGFYGNPYPLSEIKAELLAAPQIGIIGTGLASIDFFVFLDKYGYERTIHFLSEDGRFPMIRGKEMERELPHLDALFAESPFGYEALKEAICKDIVHFGLDVEVLLPQKQVSPVEDFERQLAHLEESALLQYIILKYHDDYPTVFSWWTKEEQEAFVEEYGSVFQLIKSPMPLESAKKLQRALTSGKAKVWMNTDTIVKEKEGFTITTKEGEQVSVDAIMNGTGPTFDFEAMAHTNDALPLIKDLLNERILQPYNPQAFAVTFPDLSVISQRYGILKNLKLHGQTIQGIRIANNDVGLIGIGVRKAVGEVLGRLF